MNEFLTFVEFGFRHIIDVEAMDHILFLVALAAIYRFKDARRVFWVVTAFTVGHSVTLALAVTGALTLPTAIIEFLIPVTIVLTGLANLSSTRSVAARPLIAGLFGLVHGAGFANYLNALFVDDVAIPLFGFNVGIEIGQVAVLLAIAALFTIADRIISVIRERDSSSALRVRIVAVSLIVVAVGSRWAVERNPW